MKKGSDTPGGGQVSASKQSSRTGGAPAKSGCQKEWRREVEREVREQRRKHQELLEQWGVTDEELAEWWETNEVDGREAACEDLCDEELCRKLIGKYARKSAARTSDIREI